MHFPSPNNRGYCKYVAGYFFWYPQIIHVSRIFLYKPSILIHFGHPIYENPNVFPVNWPPRLHRKEVEATKKIKKKKGKGKET